MSSTRRRTPLRWGLPVLLGLALAGSLTTGVRSDGPVALAAATDVPYVNPMPAPAPPGRAPAAPTGPEAIPDGTPVSVFGPRSVTNAAGGTATSTAGGTATSATTAALTSLTVPAVSQGTDMLDIFGVDAGQRIYHASWRPDDANGWNRQAQLNGGVAAPYTSVYGVSRFTGRLDVFAVGTDRQVYTAFKDTGVSRGAWQGWWPIPGLIVRPNTSVSAVRVDAQNLMILAVGEDRRIYENRWTAALPRWQGWHVVGEVLTNATVFGLAISTHVIDIYATAIRPGDATAAAWTNRWTTTGWQGWGLISGGAEMPLSGSLYPVRYSPNDVALTGIKSLSDGRTWEHRIVLNGFTINDRRWHNWGSVLNGRAYNAMSPIPAVSRRTGYLDLFHVGRDQQIYTAGFDGVTWGGWWGLGSRVSAGTGVFAISRAEDQLDLFMTNLNTGTYTRGWNPYQGWGPWIEVGPFGQAGDAIEVIDTIDFNGGTNVDGWVRLVVSSSGAWSFRGHFNSAGPLNYDVGYAALIAIPNGRGFTFQAKGTAEGWLHGGDDFNFDRAGVDPDIAAAWTQIRISGEWSMRARTSLDVGRLLGDLLVGASYAVRILDTVSAP